MPGNIDIKSNCTMKIDLKLQEGTSGDWRVEKFTLTEADAKMYNIREAINGRCRFIFAGTYWRLRYKKEIVMSNTPAEIDDHIRFISKAKGNVLIAGLGLGMVLKALLDKPEVHHITVVEESDDVIKLVSPFYQDKRVTIVHQDIFDYNPTETFDFAWFDIWTYICEDNYIDMKRLDRKFVKYAKVRKHWCYEECKKRYFKEI